MATVLYIGTIRTISSFYGYCCLYFRVLSPTLPEFIFTNPVKKNGNGYQNVNCFLIFISFGFYYLDSSFVDYVISIL